MHFYFSKTCVRFNWFGYWFAEKRTKSKEKQRIIIIKLYFEHTLNGRNAMKSWSVFGLVIVCLRALCYDNNLSAKKVKHKYAFCVDADTDTDRYSVLWWLVIRAAQCSIKWKSRTHGRTKVQKKNRIKLPVQCAVHTLIWFNIQKYTIPNTLRMYNKKKNRWNGRSVQFRAKHTYMCIRQATHTHNLNTKMKFIINCLPIGAIIIHSFSSFSSKVTWKFQIQIQNNVSRWPGGRNL